MSEPAAVVDRRTFLTQCRAAAEKRLSEQLEPLLAALPTQLEEISRQSRDREERDQYVKAQSRLYNDRAAFFEGFRTEFGVSFEGYAQALLGTGLSMAGPDRGEIAAMKTNVLENEVAVGKLAVRLKEHARTELAQLSARVATLCRQAAVDDGDNPLGPLPIARAVYAGFTALKIEGRPMRALRPELEKKLAEPVRELYQALNSAFDSHGIAPAAPRPAAAPASAPAAASAVPGGASPSASTTAPMPFAAAARASPSPAGQAAAAQAVESELAGTSLPPILDLFLRQAWVGLLARAHAAQGAGGAPWREAVTTLQEIIWSLKPKADPAERARLIGLLPTLLKKITAGMEAVALEPEGRKLVLDDLMAHHREILRPRAKPSGG